jgi:hypothetical protein
MNSEVCCQQLCENLVASHSLDSPNDTVLRYGYLSIDGRKVEWMTRSQSEDSRCS